MCFWAAPIVAAEGMAAAGTAAAMAETAAMSAWASTAATSAAASTAATTFGVANTTWSALSTAAQIGGVGMQAFSAMNAADANSKYAEYQSAVDRNNATYAEWQAQDAIERGNTAAEDKTRQAAALKATQMNTMAAHGLDLSEGTPLNIMTDTDLMMQQDVATIKNNAQREAWASRVKGSNSTANANLMMSKAQNENPWLAGAGTLMSGLGSVADRWYTYNKLGASARTGVA
jgi:hypothetical protein